MKRLFFLLAMSACLFGCSEPTTSNDQSLSEDQYESDYEAGSSTGEAASEPAGGGSEAKAGSDSK